ncbi:hypothetical protein BDY19DRAFT_994121 [Irpex rosettiformis]|uniref:Uncharacterized protein n=1 Tax=Irpex rosettiformis TaxID=378272 RepID=A0ACB8U204_9APHY|nr:hypothetical protein BDY19DRAFT_994121 [Irpex rosettiformis]
MTSAAARIPPELYSNILVFVGPYDILSTPSRSREKKEAKQLLSACSLTCFYWATQCRERIFRFLILRSLEDIRTLRSFTSSPLPRLPSILAQVRYLTAEWKLAQGQPWIHNLYIFLQSQHIRLGDEHGIEEREEGFYVFLTLHLFGPLSETPGRRRDDIRHILSRGLPRTMPPQFRRCHSLIMEDFQMNDYSEFSRLVQAMSFIPTQFHHSTRLRFRNIKFRGSQSPDPSFTFFSPWPVCVLIDVEDCSDPNILVWGSLTQLNTRFGRPEWARDLYLSQEDNQIILAIINILLQVPSPVENGKFLRFVRAGRDGSDRNPAVQLFIDVVDAFTAHGFSRDHERLSPKFCIKATARDPGSNEYYISRVSIVMVALDVVAPDEFQARCLVYDWVAIGEALQRLQEPISVDLDFYLHAHILHFFQSQSIKDTFRRSESELSVYLYDDEVAKWRIIEDPVSLLHPSGTQEESEAS